MTAVWIGKQDQEHAVRLEAHLVEIENRTYRFNTPVTAARTPHDDVERPGPDETVDRPGRRHGDGCSCELMVLSLAEDSPPETDKRGHMGQAGILL